MIMRKRPAGVSTRSKTDLSQIAKRSHNQTRREISLLTNLNRSLMEMTKVTMRLRIDRKKRSNQ
jgi:hypothetical protein